MIQTHDLNETIAEAADNGCQGDLPHHRLPGRRLSSTSLPTEEKDAEIVRSLTTLQIINGKPAADFGKEVEGK
jgi:hypothetical protein